MKQILYCLKCGELVQGILARLGSPFCQDCRPPSDVHRPSN